MLLIHLAALIERRGAPILVPCFAKMPKAMRADLSGRTEIQNPRHPEGPNTQRDF